MNQDSLWLEILTNIKSIAKQYTLNQQVIACAESCTGGLLAAAFTSIAGSSNWFDRGLVTYSNQAKIDLLGVSADTIQEFGAVSEQTAAQMSNGLLSAVSSINIAVSTTGIAGPDGGTLDKPVGTVCFGVSVRNDQTIKTRTYTQLFNGDREKIRQQAILYVTKLLQRLEV